MRIDTRMDAKSANKSSGESGYTLTELLVVLVILVLLVSIVAPRVVGYLSGAKSDTALIQIENLATSLDLFLIDVGRYPDQGEGLSSLWERPQGLGHWNGPYVRKQSGLSDPWKNPYQYRSPGEHGAYDLYSFGADNVEGGEDEGRDVTSWN